MIALFQQSSAPYQSACVSSIPLSIGAALICRSALIKEGACAQNAALPWSAICPACVALLAPLHWLHDRCRTSEASLHILTAAALRRARWLCARCGAEARDVLARIVSLPSASSLVWCHVPQGLPAHGLRLACRIDPSRLRSTVCPPACILARRCVAGARLLESCRLPVTCTSGLTSYSPLPHGLCCAAVRGLWLLCKHYSCPPSPGCVTITLHPSPLSACRCAGCVLQLLWTLPCRRH